MAPSRVLATASPCSSPASSSSPSSPLHLCLPKPPIPSLLSGVAAVLASATLPNGTILKRKRPTRLDIPVSSLAFGIPPTPSAAAPRDVVEEERDAFSVYCKRGRREYVEDRYSAADNLRRQQKLSFDGYADDGMAIMMPFQCPEVEVLGFTTIFGNVATTDATQNALLLDSVRSQAVKIFLLQRVPLSH
ncbi:hypothetical protein AHAS_Ahas12G0095700 [Arachis hypogaea]